MINVTLIAQIIQSLDRISIAKLVEKYIWDKLEKGIN